MSKSSTTTPSPPQGTPAPSIRVCPMEHRGQRYLALLFPSSPAIKTHLLQLSFVRWSHTHTCFYIANAPSYIGALVNHCRGTIWIDLSYQKQLKYNIKLAPKSSAIRSPRATPPLELRSDVVQKIEHYAAWLRQKRYQETTIKTYLSFVRQFFSRHPTLPWDGLTHILLTQYNDAEFINKNKSYSSQNQWINAIKLYLQVHRLDVGELARIERPRRGSYLPDVLTAEEVKSILVTITNLKHRTLIMLVYSSGLRIGEALNMKVSDIQSKEGLLYIRGAKGNKDRRVPLSPVMLAQLRRYYASFTPRHFLFEGQAGGKYSNKSASNILKRAVAKASITKHVTLHTLRHSYATHITQRGVGLRFVQEILGHKSPKTTMLYTHLSGTDIRTVHSPLDDLDL